MEFAGVCWNLIECSLDEGSKLVITWIIPPPPPRMHLYHLNLHLPTGMLHGGARSYKIWCVESHICPLNYKVGYKWSYEAPINGLINVYLVVD